MKKQPLFIIVFALIVVAHSCHKNSDTQHTSFTPYVLQTPKWFPAMVVPTDNAMSVERIQLGRKLYYDTLLSNNGRACGGCHIQRRGFTSDNYPGGNVLPHVNLGWSKHFLWKGEETCSLEDMMLFEVSVFFQTDLNKINANTTYRDLFYTAYGINTITYKDISYALAQFERTLTSGNSKYDQYRRLEVALTASEENGMTIFFTEKGDCFHCHGNPFFTDNSFHNNGLDSVFAGSKGRFDVTDNVNDIGLYKTPTLRNCDLRDMFMHDGRYTTLQQVIEFYNSGVNLHSQNIDPLMTLPYKALGLQLSTQDKADLLAFLQTLTDTSYINNPALSKP